MEVHFVTNFESLKTSSFSKEVRRNWPANFSEAREHASKFIEYYDLSDGPFQWDAETKKFKIQWTEINQYQPHIKERFGELNTLHHPEWLFGHCSTLGLRYMTVTATFDPAEENVKLTVNINEPPPYFYTQGPFERIYLLEDPVNE